MSVSLILTVTESSVNQAANTSVVKAVLKAKSSNGSYNNNSKSGYITIDGTKYTFSHSFGKNTTTTLATKSKTVTHNADGSKSVTVKGYYQTGVSSGNISKSVTKTLTKITRQWTVTLNNNGTKTTKTKVYGTNLALGTPTRAGYTFGGWWTGANGTGTNYGTTYTANAAITLYAKWTPITYTVQFDANGGTGTMNDESFTYDTAKALTSNGFSKTGYAFAGWATSESGDVAYSNGQSVKNLTSVSGGTVQLYAVWTDTYINPGISNIEVCRSDENGNDKLSGGYVRLSFSWTSGVNGDGYFEDTEIDVSVSGNSYYNDEDTTRAGGQVSVIIPLDLFVSDTATITVTDVANDTTVTATATLPQGGLAMHISKSEKNVTLFGIADDEKEGFFANGVGYFEDIVLDIDTDAPEGTVDGDLVAAIRALGWDDLLE